jgi:hypothetical protein
MFFNLKINVIALKLIIFTIITFIQCFHLNKNEENAFYPEKCHLIPADDQVNTKKKFFFYHLKIILRYYSLNLINQNQNINVILIQMLNVLQSILIITAAFTSN